MATTAARDGSRSQAWGSASIDIDRAVYVKGSTAFYARFAGATAARLLQGKWLKGSAAHGPLASLAALADLDKVIDSTLGDHGPLSRAADATLDGHAAVGVTDAAGDGTLYVAATGVPYPLEIASPAPAGSSLTGGTSPYRSQCLQTRSTSISCTAAAERLFGSYVYLRKPPVKRLATGVEP